MSNGTVTDLGPYTSYKSRWLLYRTTLAALLQARGIRAAVPREMHRLAETVADDQPAAHIVLDRWALLVSTSWSKQDLSGRLNAAEAAAGHDGKPHAAVVWARPGHTVAESFVVLPWAAFVDVLAAEAARADA